MTNLLLSPFPERGFVSMALEAKHDREKRPRRLECYMNAEQAIEVGIALQEAGKKVLRRDRGG